MLCAICHNFIFRSKVHLCHDCRHEAESQRLAHEITYAQGHAFTGFQYEGVIRELVLRAKVKNDIVALSVLWELMHNNFQREFATLDLNSTLVIPAPASFWGRVQGRFDVAQALSLSLFHHAEIYTGLLPGYALSTKRAGNNTANQASIAKKVESLIIRKKLQQWLQIKVSNASQVIVVDDVITTGATMVSMMEQLKIWGAKKVYGVAVALSTE